MSLTVNLCLKKESNFVQYNLNNTQFSIDNGQKVNMDFLDHDLVKEVNSLNKKQKAKIGNQLMSIVSATTIPLSFLPTKVLANPIQQTPPEIPVIGNTEHFLFDPSDLIDLIGELILLGTLMGLGAAFVLSIAAGILRMFLKQETKAKDWTTSIIKGFTQILLLPFILTAIFLLIVLLFGNSSLFPTPLDQLFPK
jgi:hypothetical protein